MKFSSLFCFFVWSVLGAAAVADSIRPNIVLILVDDLRADTLGYKGHPFVETPHIDSMAAAGIDFTNAFVTTSLCSPSRASFLTGQYMHRHGVVDNTQPMSTALQTFPYLLRQSGYRTAFIGKWHMGGSRADPRPGFEHWVSFRGQGTYSPTGKTLNVNGKEVARQSYMTDELTDYATNWLKEQKDSGVPFLLYLSHKGVHGLYDPAPRHRDRYRHARLKPPVGIAEPVVSASDKPMWVRDQRNSWHGVEFAYYGRSEQTIGEMYRHYCEMILSIDDSVGRIVQTIQELGVTDETLIVFTSDGGHLWGEHGLIDKRCAYEESMRIPLVIMCPKRIRAGTRCDQLVANIDLAPTLLELGGVEIPERIDGRSLVSRFKTSPTTDSWRQTLLYEYYWEPNFPQTPTTFALRGTRFKLIQYHGIWDIDELYDLQRDPREQQNLIENAEMSHRVAEMRAALYEQLRKTQGLVIPLGHKRNAGANLRRVDGTRRSRFPKQLLKESNLK